MPADLSAGGPDLRIQSRCGQPGDTGNELGIGAYCDNSTPCTGMNTICSSIRNDAANPQLNTFFCTTLCQAGSNTCGTNASCVCEGGLCGCAPDRCPRPGG